MTGNKGCPAHAWPWQSSIVRRGGGSRFSSGSGERVPQHRGRGLRSKTSMRWPAGTRSLPDAPRPAMRQRIGVLRSGAARCRGRPTGTTRAGFWRAARLWPDYPVGRHIAGIICPVLSEKPDTTFAKFGRIGGGEFLLRHRVQISSVSLSDKLGAVQTRASSRPAKRAVGCPPDQAQQSAGLLSRYLLV